MPHSYLDYSKGACEDLISKIGSTQGDNLVKSNGDRTSQACFVLCMTITQSYPRMCRVQTKRVCMDMSAMFLNHKKEHAEPEARANDFWLLSLSV